MSFDLSNFSHQPNHIFMCQRCFAILDKAPKPLNADSLPKCTICDVEYDAGNRYSKYDTAMYLTHQNLRIKYSNDFVYYNTLAEIAQRGNNHIQNRKDINYPPLRALYDAIASAKHFVHFATYGINQSILGALEFASHTGINVRGVATIPNFQGDKKGYNYYLCQQIDKMGYLHPNLDIRYKNNDFVHSKFFIIDGLLMFSGSANATFNAYINIEKYFEDMEIITDFSTITEKHNRLFSNPWITDDGFNSINMDEGKLYFYDYDLNMPTGTYGNSPQNLDDIPF